MNISSEVKIITKEEALNLVLNDSNEMKNLPKDLQKDYDIIIASIRTTYTPLIWVSKINKEIINYIFNNNKYNDEIYHILKCRYGHILENVDYYLKNNKKLIEILLIFNSDTIKFASEEILNDKIFWINNIIKYSQYIDIITPYLSDNLKDDDELIKIIINYNLYYKNIYHMSYRLKNNYKIMLQAITSNSLTLQFVSNKLQDNIDIVTEAVNKKGLTLKFASKNLQNNKAVVLKAVANNGVALEFASKDLQNDKDVVLKAVINDGLALQFASKELQDDKDVVSQAINNDAVSLKFASKNLQNDKDIVLPAIIKNGLVLQFASKDLQNNIECVINAVSNYGGSLEFASKKLKNDKNVVSTAVINIGIALQFASKELQDDNEIVINAIGNYGGLALEFASERLKNNKKIVFQAFKCDNNQFILYFANKELFNDIKFVLKLLKYNSTILKIIKLPDIIYDNQKFICKIIKNSDNFKFASNRLKQNKKFIFYLLNKNYINIIQYLDKKILDDDDIIQYIINNIQMIIYVSDRLQGEILLNLDKYSTLYKIGTFYINNNLLSKLSTNILDNKEIMLQLIQKNYRIYYFLSEKLKNDDDCLFEIIKYEPEILLKSYLKNKINKDFIIKIINLNLITFSNLPEKIQDKFKDFKIIFDTNETNITKIINTSLINVKYISNNEYVLNLIFKYNLEFFINYWYKNKNIKNIFINYIEQDEKLSIILFEKYNIIFENIKIFDENLNIDDLNIDNLMLMKILNIYDLNIDDINIDNLNIDDINIDDLNKKKFIEIQNLNKINMKNKIIIYY
jgi:hypothetical protein